MLEVIVTTVFITFFCEMLFIGIPLRFMDQFRTRKNSYILFQELLTFLSDINILEVKDIKWMEHIIYDSQNNRFFLFEDINNNSLHYHQINIMPLLFNTNLSIYPNNFTTDYIEEQLQLPIFKRDKYFEVFDDKGNIDTILLKSVLDFYDYNNYEDFFTLKILLEYEKYKKNIKRNKNIK